MEWGNLVAYVDRLGGKNRIPPFSFYYSSFKEELATATSKSAMVLVLFDNAFV